MKTIKLSYSILNAWASGNQQDAIAYYLGEDIPPTAYMELGRAKHEEWEAHIKKWRKVPGELGGGALTDPVVEQKYEKIIPMGSEYQILLRGRLDCSDEGDTRIWDWKCGKGMPNTYVDTMQMPYYKLLIPKAKIAIYRCFNPYRKTWSAGIRFLSEKDAEQALEHIVTFGGEMIDYLERNGLTRDYKPEVYAKGAPA